MPQLAYTILVNNKFSQQKIKLKGIAVCSKTLTENYAYVIRYHLPSHLSNFLICTDENFQIGNAWIDDVASIKGIYDYIWTHALSSDQTHELIEKYCDVTSENVSAMCVNATRTAAIEIGNIDDYNIYAPLCHDSSLKNGSAGSVSYTPISWCETFLHNGKDNSKLYKHMNFICFNGNTCFQPNERIIKITSCSLSFDSLVHLHLFLFSLSYNAAYTLFSGSNWCNILAVISNSH